MLPRFQRIPRNRLEYIFKKGKKIGNRYFVCKYLSIHRAHGQSPAKNFSRFCVVISTKIESKAVKRNLLRRRIYEAIRLHQHLLPVSCDIILIIKSDCAALKYNEIVKNILNFFQNAK